MHRARGLHPVSCHLAPLHFQENRSTTTTIQQTDTAYSMIYLISCPNKPTTKKELKVFSLRALISSLKSPNMRHFIFKAFLILA